MFSKTTEYALRATIYIVQHGSEDNKLGIDEIANAIDSPKPFTAKILQLLTKDKVLYSTRGPNGGFYFTDKSRKLPVSSILKALNEDGILKSCVIGLRNCTQKSPCPMHGEFKEIRDKLNDLFAKKTIGSLVNKEHQFKTFINNARK